MIVTSGNEVDSTITFKYISTMTDTQDPRNVCHDEAHAAHGRKYFHGAPCLCKKTTEPMHPVDVLPFASDHWIQSYAHGLAVEPFDLQPDQIEIADIAHALTNLCRYTGHVREFYSVATHSIAVMFLADAQSMSPRVQLWALLHDAGEAYLSDIAAPLKRHPIFAGYRALEKEIDERIRSRFGCALSESEIAAVRELDRALLAPEKETLLKAPPRPWFPIPQVYGAHAAFERARHLRGDTAALYRYHFHRLTSNL